MEENRLHAVEAFAVGVMDATDRNSNARTRIVKATPRVEVVCNNSGWVGAGEPSLMPTTPMSMSAFRSAVTWDRAEAEGRKGLK